MGWRTGTQIQKSLALLEKKGIRFLNSAVETLDFEQRKVGTSVEELIYDYLVIALGADTCPGKLPGFAEEAHDLFSLQGVKEMRRATQELKKGRLVVLVSSIPFKCPAAPYEAALILSALRTEDPVSYTHLRAHETDS